MKKITAIITLSIIFAVLACISIFIDKPLWAIISIVSSATLGSTVSIILAEIDTHGQKIKLLFQRFKYWKTDIRLSFSYLYRIQVNGKYLLVRGNRLKNQYQPVGGVYKFYAEAKSTLNQLKYVPDIKMGNTDETDDLRIHIKGKYILRFMEWFLSMQDREYDPTREFVEELIEPGLLPPELFTKIKYRKVSVHNIGIQHSKYNDCKELIYADIFELSLTEEQKRTITAAVLKHPEKLCLATAHELKTECCNGIEKNIGNNAVWLLGED